MFVTLRKSDGFDFTTGGLSNFNPPQTALLGKQKMIKYNEKNI